MTNTKNQTPSSKYPFYFGSWFLSRFIILDYNIQENRGSRKAGELETCTQRRLDESCKSTIKR